MRVLVVTSVAAEREAVLRGLGLSSIDADRSIRATDAGHHLVIVTGGVGMAAAAAAAAWLLRERYAHEPEPFDLVVSAGVAGGFAGRAPVTGTVLASRSVAADLGAQSPEGFLSLDELGLGSSIMEASVDVLAQLRTRLPYATVGDVLTVSTVTGTARRAAELLTRHPYAVAEAMEGFGVATAASRAGVAFAELRTIANPVGPRERASWRLAEALEALAAAAPALANLEPLREQGRVP